MARISILGLLLLSALSVSAVGADDKPGVVILTTGGTIASRVTESALSGDSLIAAVPGLSRYAVIRVEELFRASSSEIAPPDWIRLSKRIDQIFDHDPDVHGIVVTHGTDTMEETAFFLNLTVRDDRPVVVTGSMRAADERSADGPANLISAVRVAGSEASRGRGVLVVMNEEIFAARDIWKTDNRRLQSLRSPPFGILGYSDPDAVSFGRSPVRPHTTESEFDISEIDSLADVVIVMDYTGFDSRMMADIVKRRPDGIVIASFAGGRLSRGGREAAGYVVEAGIPLVVASRVPGGRIVGSPLGDSAAVLSRDLSPQKSRILLMLAMTRSREPEAIQAIFDRY